MFDDVEGEIVKAAKGPDDEREKGGGFEVGMLGEEDDGGEEAEKEKEEAFDFNPARVSEIFHRSPSFAEGSQKQSQLWGGFGRGVVLHEQVGESLGQAELEDVACADDAVGVDDLNLGPSFIVPGLENGAGTAVEECRPSHSLGFDRLFCLEDVAIAIDAEDGYRSVFMLFEQGKKRFCFRWTCLAPKDEKNYLAAIGIERQGAAIQIVAFGYGRGLTDADVAQIVQLRTGKVAQRFSA